MRFLLCKMNERTVCNMLLIFNRYKYSQKTDYKTTISNQRDHIFQLMRSQLTKKPASPPTNQQKTADRLDRYNVQETAVSPTAKIYFFEHQIALKICP